VFLEGSHDLFSFLARAEELLSTEGLDVRVKLDHYAQVLQRILLSWSSDGGMFRRVDLALDLAGSNQSVEVRVSDQRARESVVEFQLGLFSVSSIKRIEFFISVLSPDDESSEMATRCKEKDVQAVDIKGFNTGEIAESAKKCPLLFVDDQRPFSLDVSPVSCLTFSCSDLLGVLDFLDISVGFQGFEQFYSLRCFVKRSNGVSANN